MDTILLQPVTWDFLIDSNGNIAISEDPYSLAQDIASAIKLFQGELYYDTTQGIPYFEDILGQVPSAALIAASMEAAALTVPTVINAKLTELNYDPNTRQLIGSLEATTDAGVTLTVNF